MGFLLGLSNFRGYVKFQGCTPHLTPWQPWPNMLALQGIQKTSQIFHSFTLLCKLHPPQTPLFFLSMKYSNPLHKALSNLPEKAYSENLFRENRVKTIQKSGDFATIRCVAWSLWGPSEGNHVHLGSPKPLFVVVGASATSAKVRPGRWFPTCGWERDEIGGVETLQRQISCDWKNCWWKLLWGQGTRDINSTWCWLQSWVISFDWKLPKRSQKLHVGVMAPVLGRHCQAQTTAQRRATSANPEVHCPAELPT